MRLQNVFIGSKPQRQGLSLALAISEDLLKGRGAWRVHGGGFAGTMQAYVPEDLSRNYKVVMQQTLGTGCCHVLTIRSQGAMMVLPQELA